MVDSLGGPRLILPRARAQRPNHVVEESQWT